MHLDIRDVLSDDKVYRLRCMRSLLLQIKEDHADCNRLWKRLRKGKVDMRELEELVQALGRLKQGLGAFKEMRNNGLEGVFWGEMESIEKSITDKENDLREILFSIHKETVKSKIG
jgi:hypothetical protein